MESFAQWQVWQYLLWFLGQLHAPKSPHLWTRPWNTWTPRIKPGEVKSVSRGSNNQHQDQVVCKKALMQFTAHLTGHVQSLASMSCHLETSTGNKSNLCHVLGHSSHFTGIIPYTPSVPPTDYHREPDHVPAPNPQNTCRLYGHTVPKPL